MPHGFTGSQWETPKSHRNSDFTIQFQLLFKNSNPKYKGLPAYSIILLLIQQLLFWLFYSQQHQLWWLTLAVWLLLHIQLLSPCFFDVLSSFCSTVVFTGPRYQQWWTKKEMFWQKDGTLTLFNKITPKEFDVQTWVMSIWKVHEVPTDAHVDKSWENYYTPQAWMEALFCSYKQYIVS